MRPKFLQVLLEETRSWRDLSILGMPFSRLWQAGSKLGIVLAIVFLTLEALLYTVNPILLRHLIDVLNRGYNFGWQTPAPFAVWFRPELTCQQAAVYLTYGITTLSVLWYAAYNTGSGFARNASYHSQITFGSEVFTHILTLSTDYHIKSNKGELVQKTDSAIQQAQEFLYQSFFNSFLRACLSIVMILTVMYRTDWRIFAICCSTLLLGLYTNIIFGSRVSKEEKLAWKKVTEVNNRSRDVLNNIDEVKIFGNEDYEAKRRESQAEEQLPPLRRVSLLWRKLTSLENLLQNAGFIATMKFIILPGVFAHRFSVGQTAQFVSYYLMLFGYFMDMLFKYLQAQRLVPKLRDLKDILEHLPTVVDVPNAKPYRGLKSEYRFENVSFAYGKNPTIVESVDLRIPKGRITVLAGKTGSGKSTLVRLLTRLYDPTTGVVLSDGVDIREFNQSSYRRSFAVLSQQAYLFNDTIAYNISYSRLGSSQEEIENAAKVAQIHESILKRPGGYHSVLYERSGNVSGGEKQRIALARAVLARDADTVVLDEPTTGLDKLTAKKFLDELLRVFDQKTIVMITHEKSIMKSADQIVYVQNGRVYTGSHDELLQNNEEYYELVTA